MTIKVKLKEQPKITTNIQLGEQTVPTRISASLFTGRLDQLTDVNASGETDGATLVYNAETDTYVTEKLNFGDIDGGVDGGNF
jgi:hypothetical protein